MIKKGSLDKIEFVGGEITFDDNGNALCVNKAILGPNLPNVNTPHVFEDSCFLTAQEGFL